MKENIKAKGSRWLLAYSRGFQKFLPSPFAIALLLTAVAGLSALLITDAEMVLRAWSDGLWNPSLLRFGFQAMFMLVLGHVLALSTPVKYFLDKVVILAVRNTALAPAYVAFFALMLGWLNWGLGLVAGALLAKSVIDKSEKHGYGIRPGLLGAAGYMGLLVWHSGLSGSAPLKVAESGHLLSLYPKGADWQQPIPDAISISSTVFSTWNISITIGVILAVVLLFAVLGHLFHQQTLESKTLTSQLSQTDQDLSSDHVHNFSISEKLDNGRWLAWVFGVLFLGTAIWLTMSSDSESTRLGFVTPDWINLILLGLALLAHGSIKNLLSALEKAIGGASGILLQFPIYFGIMGVVTGTGLVNILSGALVSSTNITTLPLVIFTSSGVLNIFVPSGGGQWAVQGPLVIEACHSMGMSLEKGIMAMAYGDQWTNMLQPFWALPLLGITKLKAQDILPFTLAALIVSGLVFIIGLLLIP